MTQTTADLRQDVSDELEFDPSVGGADIVVSIDGDVVTLSGHVDTLARRCAAERAALRVDGVGAVANEIDVRLEAHHARPDEAIASAAMHAIEWDVTVPEGAVKVAVSDGRVTLTGQVDWHYQRDAAERDVRVLRGVRSVTNLVTISPRVSAADVKHRIRAALRRNAGVDESDIEVDVIGSMVVLSGTVHTWKERTQAAHAAWSAFGVTHVENRVFVAG